MNHVRHTHTHNPILPDYFPDRFRSRYSPPLLLRSRYPNTTSRQKQCPQQPPTRKTLQTQTGRKRIETPRMYRGISTALIGKSRPRLVSQPIVIDASFSHTCGCLRRLEFSPTTMTKHVNVFLGTGPHYRRERYWRITVMSPRRMFCGTLQR